MREFEANSSTVSDYELESAGRKAGNNKQVYRY
jgi:hypothetical protein